MEKKSNVLVLGCTIIQLADHISLNFSTPKLTVQHIKADCHIIDLFYHFTVQLHDWGHKSHHYYHKWFIHEDILIKVNYR